eukprot:COSAG06_NODE_7923_length_2333_cov_1.253805_2_plen_130_part_00
MDDEAADALLDAGYDHDEGCYTGQGVMRYIDSSGTETVFWPIVFNIKRSFYHDRLGTDIGKAQNKNTVLSRLGRSDEAAEGASRADGWYLLLLLPALPVVYLLLLLLLVLVPASTVTSCVPKADGTPLH